MYSTQVSRNIYHLARQLSSGCESRVSPQEYVKCIREVGQEMTALCLNLISSSKPGFVKTPTYIEYVRTPPGLVIWFDWLQGLFPRVMLIGHITS